MFASIQLCLKHRNFILFLCVEISWKRTVGKYQEIRWNSGILQCATGINNKDLNRELREINTFNIKQAKYLNVCKIWKVLVINTCRQISRLNKLKKDSIIPWNGNEEGSSLAIKVSWLTRITAKQVGCWFSQIGFFQIIHYNKTHLKNPIVTPWSQILMSFFIFQFHWVWSHL